MKVHIINHRCGDDEKVLPKIHKISLDMIAKDIFRSENK